MVFFSRVLASLGLGCLVVAGSVLSVAGANGQGAGATVGGGTKARGDSAVARLEADIPGLMKLGDVPGMAVAVVRGGKISWARNFGVKNAKTGQAVDENTVFEAASLSKPVFAYAVLKLVEQGKIGLDVPLTTYFSRPNAAQEERAQSSAAKSEGAAPGAKPEGTKPFVEGDARLEKITARIVLSHRTGFPNWRGDDGLTIHFMPGERFSYSGEGFIYLQRAVEQIEGKPLNEVMNALVFGPQGMTSSSYVWRPDFDEKTATGHDSEAMPQDLWKPKEALAASSLNTTADDYAKFVVALVDGAGLKRATLREMETPQIAVDPECTNCTERAPKELSKEIFWGLGWGIEKKGGEEWLWHWGDNGSFKCFVTMNPAQKSGVVLFTNSENGLSIAPAVIRDATGEDHAEFGWLKYDGYDSVAMKFRKAVREKGVEAAIQEFSAPLQDGTIPEQAVNSIGYGLLEKNKTAEAIRVFALNTELHPQSANTFDSLGEAYMESGDKVLAIQNYEKSLALNPQNKNAAKRLEKLREGAK